MSPCVTKPRNAKDEQLPSDVRRGSWDRCSLTARRGADLADTLILGLDLRNSERTHFCCRKPRSLQWSDVAALANQYTHSKESSGPRCYQCHC